MIVLGIDPDKGWAIADHSRPKENRMLGAGSVKGLHEMFVLLREMANDEVLQIDEVRIERPVNKHAYQRPGQSTAAMKSIAVNVGENLAKGDALYYFCLGLGFENVVRTSPIKNGTKLSAKQIELFTGWRKKTNEHARDAIIIAWIDHNPAVASLGKKRRQPPVCKERSAAYA